ncbi:hypothetical protein ABJY94_18305 [Vibrio parahaemolyticus]|uniref:hypothetical protein n=1 Tax=Vibrio parahaemolyticus TaxID=670 RepID=UPI0032AF69EE
MSNETYVYGAVVDGFVVVVEIKDAYMFPKADAFLYPMGSREDIVKILTQPKFHFDLKTEIRTLDSVSVVDLLGNGDSSGRTGKGYGKIVTQACFNALVQHFETAKPECVTVRGSLSSVGDEHDESHYRRVRFWQRNGLTVSEPEDRYSSIKGTLAGCINYPIKLVSFGNISKAEAVKELNK